MKKIYIIIMVLGAFFTACNPNKDIYQNLDDNAVPYNESFGITLSDADYTTIKKLALPKAETEEDSTLAYEIATYLSFSEKRDISKYAPDFLAQSFVALDSGSKIMVTYNYAVNEYDKLDFYEITSTNFISMQVYALTFSSSALPENYLPAFLDNIDNTPGYVLYVTAKYKYDNGTIVDSTMLYTRDDADWHYVSNQYELVSADYDSMGAPGNNDRFSSDIPAADYLPTFLKLKYPYAVDEDEILVAYNYDIGYSKPMIDVYRFDGNIWKNSKLKSDQFIHSGTEWIFDPTINYTMTKDDYQIIVDYVTDNVTLNIYLDPTYPDNTEWYYGTSAYYGNFDLRVSKRRSNDPENLYSSMSDDEVLAIAFERLGEAAVVFASAKFPDAQPFANGVEVYYIINMKTYQPGYYYYDVKIKCIAPGEFEYIEGPTEVK